MATGKDALAKLIAGAEKKYDFPVAPMSKIASNTKFVSTQNMAIDYVMGGGIPLGRVVEIAGLPSSGKAQRWTDVVHTPDRGYVQIKNLNVGDRISSTDGSSSTLTGVYPQGVKDMVRFNFSDGTSAVSSTEHLWTVKTMSKLFGLQEITVTASKIMEAIDSKAFRSRDLILPTYDPVERDATTLPLDPYLVGALIGDGGLTQGSPIITTMDSYIIDRVSSALPEGVTAVAASKDGRATSYRLTTGNLGGLKNPLTSKLRELGLWGKYSYEKRIPGLYFSGTVAQRLALLQGLMDTDGQGRGPDGGGWQNRSVYYFTSSEGLASDVADLARSLGIAAFVRQKEPFYRDAYGTKLQGRTAYRVEMREFDTEGLSVFGLDRKKPTGSGIARNRNRKFMSYELLEAEEAVCISVSARNSLYFTNDFIPTHNTTTALQAGAELQRVIREGGDASRGITPDDKILYLDYEQAMDPTYAKALGLDTDDETFLFGQPSSLEKGGNLSLEMGKTGLIRLIIIDSVAAMQSETVLANDVGAHNVGTQAKFVTDYITKMNVVARENNIAVVLINHTKEKIGMGRPGMPPVTTTPGGVGAKYFASVRLEYSPRKQHKASVYDPVLDEKIDQVVANDVLVKSIKNKIAPPYRKQVVKVRYGKGFDNFFTAITVLIAHKKVMYSSGMFYFHKIADEGGAPEWMPRATTGTQRPYIKGELNLYAAAENDPEWSQLLQLMAETLIYETPDTEVVANDEEESEDEIAENLPKLNGPGNKVSL